jgi:D-alanyl-D-alanine carboxypeptidase/D-alanyl-D-alanine-endopeptidase (penicillin-binding protein 4)
MERRRLCTALGVSILLSVVASLTAMPATASPPESAPQANSVASAGAQVRTSHIDVLLHRRLGDPRLGRKVSMIVIDARTGTLISAQHPNRPMQPASNMKIITAVNAIAVLGPHTRFVTKVLAGRMPRDVILQGAGDPLLSRHDLESLAVRTAKQLGNSASIRLHADDDLFPAPSAAPGWVPAYVGNSVGFIQALAVHGDRSRHPSRNALESFAAMLRHRGLTVTVGGHQDAAPDAKVLARTRAHTVADAVAVMLSNSDSSIAELLYRQVAIALGRPPTWRGSQRAAKQSLALLGVDTRRMVLADGSGLSRLDRISPRLLADLLRVARVTQAKRFATMFRPNALPVAGRTGTLDTSFGRYTTSPSRCARGHVQAKTGTILGTIALSGVATTSRGTQRIFSVIVNDRPLRYSALSTRRAVDALAATVVGCWR